jgi:hypothetical protein
MKFKHCVADHVGSLGFAVEQFGSLFGAHWNARRDFQKSAGNGSVW